MIARLLLESQSYEEIPYLPEISFLLGHYLLLIMFSSGIFFPKLVRQAAITINAIFSQMRQTSKQCLPRTYHSRQNQVL